MGRETVSKRWIYFISLYHTSMTNPSNSLIDHLYRYDTRTFEYVVIDP